ncbi:MAG: GNAT family N-acetyltransferase [Oceanospirillaceae bacterium]|nr:GNAT family N-acetyltransferase [Oceanospirillaceae bacterium]
MIQVLPLSEDNWPDLERLFAARGCSEARRCWCMYYRMTGSEWNHVSAELGREMRQLTHDRLQTLAGSECPPGLIAFDHDLPVGWVSLGPRQDYRRLERSQVMKAVDDRAVWSVICFVVPSQYRGQGVAHALLRGAIAFAQSHNAETLEAYPVDREAGGKAQASWFGSASMFAAAGFCEVARHRSDRPVMRLDLPNDRT